MIKQILIVSISIIILGCTVDGDITHNNIHQLCTDTRDGEQFSFYTKTAHNARMGFGGAVSSVDIIDDTGKKRTITEGMEAYWKCVDTNDTL